MPNAIAKILNDNNLLGALVQWLNFGINDDEFAVRTEFENTGLCESLQECGWYISSQYSEVIDICKYSRLPCWEIIGDDIVNSVLLQPRSLQYIYTCNESYAQALHGDMLLGFV